MSQYTTSLPFFQPAGIEATAVGQSPWELLVNVLPTDRGWEPAPSVRRVGSINSAEYLWAEDYYDGKRPLLVVAGFDSSSARIRLIGLSETGETIFEGQIHKADIGIGGHRDYTAAALNRRLFFSAGSNQINYLAPAGHDEAVDVAVMTASHRVFRLVFRQGVNSVNWPYVTGTFRARILETHLQRVFFAGFSIGQQITFDQAISDEQRYLIKDLLDVQHSTYVRVNPQCIVWTDPDDPFAIGLPNFVQVGTRHKITALHSWRDRLFIFTTNDVWVMSGMREEEFSLRRVCDGIGCQDASTVTSGPQGVFFANAHGIYATDGDNVSRLSDPVDHLFETGVQFPTTLSGVGAPFQLTYRFGAMKYWPKREEVWIPVYASGATEPEYGLVFHAKNKTWAMVYDNCIGVGGIAHVGSTAFAIDHVTNVHINRFTGANKAGNDVIGSGASYLTSGAYHLMLSKPILLEQARKFFVRACNLVYRRCPDGLTFEASSATVSGATFYLYDEEHGPEHGGTLQSHPIGPTPHTLGSADKWGSGTWGTMKWTKRNVQHFQFPLRANSRYVRFAIYGRSCSGWLLRGMNILVQPLQPAGGSE